MWNGKVASETLAILITSYEYITCRVQDAVAPALFRPDLT